MQRLTRTDEYSDKTVPEKLNQADVLFLEGKEYKMSDLFRLVEKNDPEVFERETVVWKAVSKEFSGTAKAARSFF